MKIFAKRHQKKVKAGQSSLSNPSDFLGSFYQKILHFHFKAGADAVLASHSHVLQEAGFTSDGKPYSYSLVGSWVKVSPNLQEYLPFRRN